MAALDLTVLGHLRALIASTDWDRAQILGQTLVQHAPTDAAARIELAKVMRARGRPLVALMHLAIAHELAPRSEEPCSLALRICLEIGDELQAARWLPFCPKRDGCGPDEIRALHRRFPVRFLNVGGGPEFLYPFWANLDSVTGPLNPLSFRFEPDCHFPFSDGTMELAYSSHAIEHLDTPTVEGVVREMHRVLQPHGAIVIKIPDFSRLLTAWKQGDASHFSDEAWNFPVVTLTLKNRGLTDSLNRRAAYLFCGFWNRAFGNLFGSFDPFAAGAYNGPPAVSDAELAIILNQQSPNAIAAALRNHVMANETDFTFNHQNAWSIAEFAALLDEEGLALLSTDKRKIAERYAFIPGILEMYDISAYFLAVPKRRGA